MSKQSKYLNLQLMCRVAYPKFAKKHSYMGSKPKYEAAIIIQEPKEIKKFYKYLGAVQQKHTTAALPGREGNEARANNEDFKDSIFFTAKSDFQPIIMDLRDNTRIEPALVRSGDYAIVSLVLYYSVMYNRICVGLNNVYIYKETENEIGNIIKPEIEIASFADDYADILKEAKSQGNLLPKAPPAAQVGPPIGKLPIDEPTIGIPEKGFYDVGDDDDIPFYDGKAGKAG